MLTRLLAWARGGERLRERFLDGETTHSLFPFTAALVQRFLRFISQWQSFGFTSIFFSRRQMDDIDVFSYSFSQNDVIKISPTIIYIMQQWKLSSTYRNCSNWKKTPTLTPRMGYHGNCNWDGSKLLVFYGLHLQRTEHNQITGIAVQLSVEGH